MKKDRVMLTRVDVYIADRVEYIANNSKDLELTKSEVVRIKYNIACIFQITKG